MTKNLLTLKNQGGGGIYPSDADIACIPSIFTKTPQIFFEKLMMIENENWRNDGRFSKFGQFCVTCIVDFSTT